MSDLTRYDLVDIGIYESLNTMVISEIGEWVNYEDYEKLKKEVDELKRSIQSHLEANKELDINDMRLYRDAGIWNIGGKGEVSE